MMSGTYQKGLLFGAFILSFSGLFYGAFIEPNHVVVRYVNIRDNSLFRAWHGLRLVQLSDLHITRIGSREKAVISMIGAIAPDVICVTGDLAQWRSSSSEVVRCLESLRSRYGVYVVLGDSDMSTGKVRCFFCHRSGNIHLLRKNPVFLRNDLADLKTVDGRQMQILGISPNMKPEEFPVFWRKIRRKCSDNEPLLIMSHFSSLWKLVPPDEHVLWLSGNTHGGQVWLPRFLWPVFRGKDYVHLRGLFGSAQGGKWLYVNQGLGTTREFPLRIGVPPEITVITFAQENRKGPDD